MARSTESLLDDISAHLGIPREEAELYLSSLIDGRIRGADAKAAELAESLMAKGMLIKGGSGEDYVPVHPRLALSNLFRIYEERLARERKEKRLLVDRLTLELLGVYEKAKRRNLGIERGEGRR